MEEIILQDKIDCEQSLRIIEDKLTRIVCNRMLKILHKKIGCIFEYLCDLVDLDEQEDEYKRKYNKLPKLYLEMMKVYNELYKNNYDRFFNDTDCLKSRMIYIIRIYFQEYHNKRSLDDFMKMRI